MTAIFSMTGSPENRYCCVTSSYSFDDVDEHFRFYCPMTITMRTMLFQHVQAEIGFPTMQIIEGDRIVLR